MFVKCYICGKEEVVKDNESTILHVICSQFCHDVIDDWADGRYGKLTIREAYVRARAETDAVQELAGDGTGRLL